MGFKLHSLKFPNHPNSTLAEDEAASQGNPQPRALNFYITGDHQVSQPLSSSSLLPGAETSPEEKKNPKHWQEPTEMPSSSS